MNGDPTVIENTLKFDSRGVIIENYDFNGYQLVFTSLTWAPYLTVSDCDNEGRNCNFYGFFGDMMDIYSTDFNFTWDIYADINNDWGLSPKSGPYNRSGKICN